MPPIQSPQNPQIKHLSKLITQAKYRRQHAQSVLEGTHLLDAYLNAQHTPEHVYIPESTFRQPEIETLLQRLPNHLCTPISSEIAQKISHLTHACELITLIRLPENTAAPTSGDCIVLDRVQDPGNLGTVLRSAAAAGIRHIILGEGCADAYAPKVLRAGMGAHFLLRIHERIALSQWCQHYTHPIYATALSEHQPRPLYQLNLTAPCAWMFGNEGAGIAPALIAQATHSVKIPMLGQTESLNIAMAATICLFEQMRQRIQAT